MLAVCYSVYYDVQDWCFNQCLSSPSVVVSAIVLIFCGCHLIHFYTVYPAQFICCNISKCTSLSIFEPYIFTLPTLTVLNIYFCTCFSISCTISWLFFAFISVSVVVTLFAAMLLAYSNVSF